jgi:hypothetical protein
MPSSRIWCSGTSEGAPLIRSVALAVLGERDHVAQRLLPRHQHHEPVEAERDPAVRRRAVAQRLEEEAEAVLGFLVRQRQQLEDLRLQLGVMDPQAAAADLDAVQHDVIGLGAHLRRQRVELWHVLVARRP